MPKLQHLSCAYTQVSDLSLFRKRIEKGLPVKWACWQEHFHESPENSHRRPAILIRDCPLICPPAEVAQISAQAVQDYFKGLGATSVQTSLVKVQIFLCNVPRKTP